VLASGQVITATLTFAPTATGTLSDSLSFTSDGGNATVALSGTGTQPGHLSVPASVTASAAVGGSVLMSFVVTNDGGSPVHITLSKAPSNPAFTVVQGIGEGATVAPGASLTAQLRFTPAAIGTVTDAWVLNADDGGTQRSVSIIGNGVAGAPGITYMQGSSASPQSAPKTVSAAFPSAEVAADLNVVLISWNDTTATVSSVTDSNGNAYKLATGTSATSTDGPATIAIYYAAGIAAGADTVTVTFTQNASYPELIVAEYRGLDPVSPFDVGAAAAGNSATTDSGPATLSGANELIVATNYIANYTTGPGPGFTQRFITTPNGDILEDEIVPASGAYHATAIQNPAGWWVAAMAAFHPAASTGGGSDAGSDATVDSGDSGADATVADGAADGGVEASLDAEAGSSGDASDGASADAGGDSGSDTGVDAGSADSGHDASHDADAGHDTGSVAPIRYVQGSSASPQTSLTAVSVPYPTAEAAGDLNVVFISWNDATSTVASVTDSAGNAYQAAPGTSATSALGPASIVVYYAANVAGGANTLTVTFNQAAPFPEIVVAEYSGINKTSPFDVGAAASGSSATTDSGAATTSAKNELIVSSNYVASYTTGPGAGFTQRFITSPNGDILEDRVAATSGSYHATAVQSSADWYVAAMAAFHGQ
jgi:hypothetical protein